MPPSSQYVSISLGNSLEPKRPQAIEPTMITDAPTRYQNSKS